MDLFGTLEIVSFGLTIIALYLLSLPNRNTFIIFAISMLVQMVIFYNKEMWFMFMQMVVILGFNIYSYKTWTTQGVG
jgi:hypothetical protein